MPRYRPRGVRLLPLAACFLMPSGASAQSFTAVAIPPPPDSTIQRVAAEVTIPAGFELSLFAAPPHLTYPVVLEPAESGVLFVGTDPNLIFDRDRHRGRILRLVDDDGDGSADRYTIFADSLDSVRGLVYDGETLYVVHPPTVSAMRDADGDGRADEARVLVSGLGFGLDDRGGDHTTNGIRLGIDGWLYIAVGDYGFLAASGTDGSRLNLHRGGVVRVRPDGTEMEIVARGTRNIYDLALDPQLRIFARDNTNNGQGWNSRLHYLPDGADVGYPSLFRNFPEEALPPLADFGAGAATTALWIDDPAFPGARSGALFSADWALNRIYRHDLTPRGATFDVTQEEVMSIPRPADMEMDAGSNLYIASLSAGSYSYAGEHVGYVVRIRPTGVPTDSQPPSAGELSETQLVSGILGESAVVRLRAQRELLRRGASAGAVDRLERTVRDRAVGTAARVAAIFTLKQLDPNESRELLLSVLDDPSLRAMALRALSDRRREAHGLPLRLFARAVDDADPFVRLQAVKGLTRIGSPEASRSVLRAAASDDRTVSHVARHTLSAAGGWVDALRALDGGTAWEREAALFVLGRAHNRRIVRELVRHLDGTADFADRRALLQTLARLTHREGPWDGTWWGNQPDTEGPYFRPVRWQESEPIVHALTAALRRARGEEIDVLAVDYIREGVLPRGSRELVQILAAGNDESRQWLLATMVGFREPPPESFEGLVRLSADDAALRFAALRMLVAVPLPADESLEMLRAAATDTGLPIDLRAQTLMALARSDSPAGLQTSVAAHAAVTPEIPQAAELHQPWKRFAGDRRRVAEVETFAALTRSGDDGEKVLAWAVLVQVAATPRNPEAARSRAASLIESAWSEPASAAPLVRAITLLGLEDRYADELATHREG